MEQNPQDVAFVSQNILLISLLVLGVFGYLVLIIRKRWRSNYLHKKSKPSKQI